MTSTKTTRPGSTADLPVPDPRAELESDPVTLAELTKSTDLRVRRGVARNPSTHIDGLALLAAEFPADVIGNPAVEMMIAANPAQLQSWPLQSLEAVARSPSTPAGVLAALLEAFKIDSRGNATPKAKLTFLGALLRAPQLSPGSLRSFMKRAGSRRSEWYELASMHEALRPEAATAQDAIVKIGEILTNRARLECTPTLLKPTSNHPAFWTVVAAMRDDLRVITAIRTGGITSPAFTDLVNDGTCDATMQPLHRQASAGSNGTFDLPGPCSELLTDNPSQEIQPSDEAEYRAWIRSDRAQKQAAALMSKYATLKDLKNGKRSARPTVRAAAAEGMRRVALCRAPKVRNRGASLQKHSQGLRDTTSVNDVLAVVRWPQFNGKSMLAAIEAYLRDVGQQDLQRPNPSVAILVAMLSRTDLDPLVRQRIVEIAPNVVARCAYSTSEMLGKVMRAPTTMRVRSDAAMHPSSDPIDREWLRSPEGMLDSLKSHYLDSSSLLEQVADDTAPPDGEAIAWETHGARTGNGNRLVALLIDDCPTRMLELRAGSTCLVERALVAMHAKTTAPVLARLATDPCWVVRAAAAAPRQQGRTPVRGEESPGVRARIASARAKNASIVRPKMSKIRERLGSKDWEAVRSAIHEIASSNDTQLVSLMHRDMGIRVTKRLNGDRCLEVVAGQASEIYRRVRRDFRDEASLEFVRSRLGPGTPLAHGGKLRKSLADVNGLPSLANYLPCSVDLVIEDCARLAATMTSIDGFDAVATLEFPTHGGIIPKLPRFAKAKSVKGSTQATASSPNPLAAFDSLPSLEEIRLSITSIDAGLGEVVHDLATHQNLRCLEINCTGQSHRLPIRFRCSSDHLHLKSLDLSGLRAYREAGSRLLSATTATFTNCELDAGIAELLPMVRDLKIRRCVVPIPGKLLKIARLTRLAIETDMGSKRLQLESTNDGIEEMLIRDVADLEEIGCEASLDSLTTLRVEGCKALQRITLGPSMSRLREFVVEDCPNLHSIQLPKACADLRILRVARAVKLKSATHVLKGCGAPGLEEIQFEGCSSLEDVDALAGVPALKIIDLRECKSLKSVAALRRMGHKLRVNLWGAAHADGESTLATGVATRDRHPDSGARSSPATVPAELCTAQELTDPQKEQLAAIVSALLRPLASSEPTDIASAISALRKVAGNTHASEAFRSEVSVAAIQSLRPHAGTGAFSQAKGAFRIARMLDDRGADELLLENIDAAVQPDAALRHAAALEVAELAYEDLPSDRIEAIRSGISRSSRLETSGPILEHHVDALGNLLCRRNLSRLQADSIALSEASIISDVAERFLHGYGEELLRSLQKILILARRHLAHGAEPGRRTLLPAILPILGKIAALSHAPHPVLAERASLTSTFNSMADAAEIILRFSAFGGMQIEYGFLCDLFATDAERRRVVLSNALVLTYEREIDEPDELSSFLNLVEGANRPILIVTADVTGQALCELIRRTRSGLSACVVCIPVVGDRLRTSIHDTASLTGAKPFTEESRIKLDTITIAELGQAKFIAVDSNSTEIIGGGGSLADISARRKQLRREVGAMTGWTRDRAEDRLARFEAALPPGKGADREHLVAGEAQGLPKISAKSEPPHRDDSA